MALSFQKHPPERRQRPVTTLHCGCSCCCCCCLHTVGSLLGASLAPSFGRRHRSPLFHYYVDELDNVIPLPVRSTLSAQMLFWWITLAFVAIGLVFSLTAGPSGLLIGGIAILVVFPILQLASTSITAIVLLCSSNPAKNDELLTLGKMFLGLLFGTLLGVGAMAGLVAAFSR